MPRGATATPVSLCCQLCGKSFEAPASDGHRKYCSASCTARPSRRFEVTAEDLERLVWKMPTTEVAALFGVSDKAVEKRCKKYGIRKPPRGYWAKVQADKAAGQMKSEYMDRKEPVVKTRERVR